MITKLNGINNNLTNIASFVIGFYNFIIANKQIKSTKPASTLNNSTINNDLPEIVTQSSLLSQTTVGKVKIDSKKKLYY